ncbi:hypothetical protein cypCar_00045029 [Cyprinus carpio]|nr:hypothetical protein cypCar_00045029 [Cyprinus carpio]
MADALSFLEEDLTCPICCDVFTDPVTLKCSHSLCEKCLQCFWTARDVPQCPVCRKECSQDEPTKSLAFRALSNTKYLTVYLHRLQHPSVANTIPELQEYQHYPIQTVIFTTWARMQNLVEQPPVTLDPDTASSKLLVSQDCTSVQYVEMKQDVFDNTKKLHDGVLASQGFSSGVHCWDTERFWMTRDVPQCPVCRKECSQDEPTKSLAFRALCETFKKRKPSAVSRDVCPEHEEKFKLFCFVDQQPICVVCYTSKKHEDHKCSPVDEATGILKECTSKDENQIKEDFEKLHQFLRDEEEKQIRSLHKETKLQDEKLQARMKELSAQISDLSERMAAVWQDIEAENITFLQNYSNTLISSCDSGPRHSIE